MEAVFSFVDVSLPVPLARSFTYSLPETLRHRAVPGCRIIVPFGSRKLTGMILKAHNQPPEMETREALRLLDEEPVLDAKLLALGRWVAEYYCAPLGEVLRGMAPLAGEVRQSKFWALTDQGHDVIRQLLIGETGNDPAVELLRALEQRPLSETTLERKCAGARKLLKTLERKGLLVQEQSIAGRDPLRAPAIRMRAEFNGRHEQLKLTRVQRELIAYLELHPGSHNLVDLSVAVKGASVAARALARRKLIELKPEPLAIDAAWAQPRHALNPPQQAAVDAIRGVLAERRFQTFLLHGVTGSGKTEVYLNAIEAALAAGRGVLMLVPEIGLCTRRSTTASARRSGAGCARARPWWPWERARRSSRRSRTWG
jgi:primosomal protein N' (replication factor Y)